MQKRPTVYDVAKAAGVAPSTVSRAFSRPGRVSSQTAAHIRAVAEQLGYRVATTEAPGAPSHKKTRTLALFVSDIGNPFYVEIIRGAHDSASVNGYALMLCDTQESSRAERVAVERALGTVDGIVLSSSRMSDSAIRMMAKQVPTVVLNRVLPDVHSVVTDNPRGVRRAMEHLGSLGHSTITYIAGPEASWADGVRWRAVLEAGHELDLKVRRLGSYMPTIRAGLRAARDFAERPSSAVLAYNDQMAIGLIKGFQAMGVKIPDEVSVVGFDNILLDDIVTPALTTVAAPLHSQGSIAVGNVVAMIKGAQPSQEPLVLPTKLVVRASTAQRKRKSTSPAWGTTKVSGSASKAAMSTSRGSR